MRLRIKFTKMPPITYIGHLDLMRYFQKVLRRANIPVKYSTGFSPHIEMSFALPLGVGTASIGDYLDVDLDNDEVKWLEEQYLTPKERENFVFDENSISLGLLNDIARNIQKQSIDEVYVKGINVIPDNKKNKAMTQVSSADYIVAFDYPSDDIFERDGFLSSLESFLGSDLIITKKTKGGIKDVDLTDSLIEYRLAYADSTGNKSNRFHYFRFMDNEEPYEIFKDSYVNETVDEYYENIIAGAEKGKVVLFIRAKAGSDNNLNPKLLIEQFYHNEGLREGVIHIYRLEMYGNDGKRLLDISL